MEWRWLTLVLLVAGAAGKGKKHRNHKPGRALLDRLSSTRISEGTVTSGAGSDLPAPLDVAPYSTVAANASCGYAGADEFCRDTPGKRVVVCDLCEGFDGSPSRRHPPSHTIDGDSATWWQSPTFASGDFQNVELVATLPDVESLLREAKLREMRSNEKSKYDWLKTKAVHSESYDVVLGESISLAYKKMELLHVIIKSGPSPRPLAWALEISATETGDDWRLIRAFGDREHCIKLWDLRPERRRRKARGVRRKSRADKLSCSTQFASPRPLENGEMHVGIGEGVSARRVRISFRAAHPAPPRQQYYTVRALTLAARCLCHSHARQCRVTSQGAKCECLHNTCGRHCQRCCSGGPWSPQHPCPETAINRRTEPQCECAGRGACAYDDTGALLCVNCTDNRAGPLCDRCLDGFYNEVPDGPCLPCNCHPDGSDGTCTYDTHHRAILCNCYAGYVGARCDACEDEGASLPDCRLVDTTPACKCDPRGIVDPGRVCDDVCQCKANVVGERCDTCLAGHFGLSAASDAGCTRCYCSHVTDACTAAPLTAAAPMVFPLTVGWEVTDAMENETVAPSVDDKGNLYLISYEVEGWQQFYWRTRALAGDQLALYGSRLRVRLFWGIVRGDTGGSPTVQPDVALLAADGTKLYYGNRSHDTPGQLDLLVPIVEGEWYLQGEDQSILATRTDIMDVLLDLKGLMIRAHFHGDQDEVRLESFELHPDLTVPRETCACPAGYAGAQCQRCDATHARAQAGARARCVPCARCNGHARCDTVDGPCGPCQHNTTGPHCERCLPGHYGNPVTGPCKPCACPLYLPSNNFSPNCALASAEGDEFVCTQCPDGYAGDHCEICDFGYWGSPTTAGSSCQPCACAGAPCDPATGECRTCAPHTEGARCDQCQEGYWGGAGGCVACDCGPGALSAACDPREGACVCREGWAGAKCEQCAPGHGDVAANCPKCRCGTAALNNECDNVTGECHCAPGAAPLYCDTCMEEYYGLDVSGCLGCNCSSLGAESNVCDIRTGQCRCKPHVTGRACDTCEAGQCRCKPHVTGRACDTCEEGYWGLRLGGCRRCACGAGAAACDPASGACACAPGVGGDACDGCMPGFYGFGPAGCLPCPSCSNGKVCSAESGRCVCPAHARGPGCAQCAPGYFTKHGVCEPCVCGPGALTNSCDATTGQCKCRPGWTGLECNSCVFGHSGPRCRPCLCDPAGAKDCVNETCPCDENGRCFCKENVVGNKCDTCLDGTFGLSADNPTGCTACFCFGRSAHCTQASLTRAALHAPSTAHVTLLKGDSVSQVDQNSLLAIRPHPTDVTLTLPHPPVPVYIQLGDRFLGDRVTSYGGALRFTVEEEGGLELPKETLRRFPLVRLFGKNGITLDYMERMAPINGTHSVHLHESLWSVETEDSARGVKASRSALMFVLRNVTAIMLRLTTRAATEDDPVHALLLNVSLDTAIPGLSRSQPALGVERCWCPRGYAAPSCQRAAAGYWLRDAPRATRVHGTIVINLEGEAQPCECHGRSETCDPKTGHCLNCREGTAGAQCHICAEGHYGDPQFARGCLPCPCPAPYNNHASSCLVSESTVRCFCKPGYTGPKCDSCAPTYYRTSNSSCVPCDCDETGSISPHCDVTGRCRCRQFAAGDKCDQCVASRAFMSEAGCMPCDNCTQTLLDSIEDITSELRSRVDLNEMSRIPKPFPALLEFSHNATTMRNNLLRLRRNSEHHIKVEPLIHALEEREHIVFTRANKINTNARQREKEAQFLSLESMSDLEEVLKQRRKIGELVATLEDFARGERHTTAHRALKEARHLLRKIKGIKLMDYVVGANDVSDTANLQSTAVQEYNYSIDDTLRRIARLRSEVDSWETRADDVPLLAAKVFGAGDVLAASRLPQRLEAAKDMALRCRLVLEDITNLSPHNYTNEAAYSLAVARNLVLRIPSLEAELVALTAKAEEKEGILYNLTPEYRRRYLEPVERHVQMLGRKAKEYKSVFAGTRAVASDGMTAATAWREVADTVRNASMAANQAAQAAHSAANMARGPVPMTNTAEATMAASEELKRRGAAVLAKAEELTTQLEHLRRGADLVSVILRGLGWQERELAARPRADVSQTLATANEQADRVFGVTRALYDEASEVRRRVRYQLRRQLADLQKSGDTALGAAQEHVSQIRSNTERGAEVAEALAGAASARAKEHETASATLSPNIAALRDKIARARHAANSISVSVTSAGGGGPGCARAYLLPSTSAAVTRVAVAVSFDTTVRDGPLLYLLDDTQETENFMKLSVEKKQLKLAWNLGSGEGLIVHPEALQPAHDDGDHTSYRIEVERVWNNVHLTVEKAGGTPLTATNSTAVTGVSLRARRLWLGAPGDVTGLPGCVHALYNDDVTVGLWNFAVQPPAAKCTGCTQRWYNAGRGDTLVRLSGGGYAELRRSALRPADPRQFSVAFTVRTRDRDALLFLALDTVNNRSVSVVMRQCRVVFEVEYGGGARLAVAAGARHCGGTARVQAIRAFSHQLERGSLRVNGEETLGSPSPPVHNAADLPDLSQSSYWVAGVPPGAPSHLATKAPPLMGCIGALTVDREGYDLMDTPTRHGIEPRCGSRTLRSAILEGHGYIELPSPLLRRKAAIGLTFRARSPNGLLLFRTPSARVDNEVDDEDDGDDKHYLALVMVEGELQVNAAAGKSEVTLKTNGTKFDDGRLHTVRIIRAHKQLELWVDEERVSTGALPGDAYPARSGGLFVGGVSGWQPARAPRVPAAGFAGTVADLIVDSSLIGFDNAIQWDGCLLGRADSEPQGAPPGQPRALQAQPQDSGQCVKTSSYTVEAGAVKFGDSPWSHAAVKMPAKPGLKHFAVSLQIRTYASDGLIFLAPGSKAKPKHYIALIVKDGKLRLIVRGRRRKELSLSTVVSDGVWRSVAVRAAGASVVLASGGAASSARAPPAAVGARLYVGGLPPPPALPHLPPAVRRAGGLVGCVRRVRAGGRAADLPRGQRRARQCFPRVERAAYLAGDAHAVWSSAWRAPGSGTSLAVQFRTASPRGVLLTATDFVLELKDGAVVLSRHSGGSEVARTEARGSICDNQWHSVVARVALTSLSLSLDGGPEMREGPGSLLDENVEALAAPLYIGGLPEGVIDSTEGAGSRENFRGCLRDVTIAGQKKGWTQMESLTNVLIDSCPVDE